MNDPRKFNIVDGWREGWLIVDEDEEPFPGRYPTMKDAEKMLEEWIAEDNAAREQAAEGHHERPRIEWEDM